MHSRSGPARPRDAEPAAGPGATSEVSAFGALSEAEAIAVILSAPGIGPIYLERLLAAFGDPREVLAAALVPSGLRAIVDASRDPEAAGTGHGMLPGIADGVAVAARRAGSVLAAMAAAGVEVLDLADPRYPERLRAILLPPRVLFVRGAIEALGARHAVAVVGTRRPSDAGRRTAARIGAALARAEALVVSGLAVGIDGAAHAAVVGEGGRTVAVIGGGHDRLFPHSHDRLARAIVETGGAIVSEHPPGTQPTRGTFPRRNRVISGLADAVVVVEAPASSGALLTSKWALDQGRPAFFVPGSIDAPESAGCLAWLRDFPDAARIVAGIPQLLEDLGLVAAAAFPALAPSRGVQPPAGEARLPSAAARARELAPREQALAAALVAGAATVDELVAVTTQPVAAVLAGLTTLEAAGLVVGRYGRYRPAGFLEREPATIARDPAA